MNISKNEGETGLQELDRVAGSNVLSFGKHIGKTFKDVTFLDRGYCSWAVSLVDARGQMMKFQSYLSRRADVQLQEAIRCHTAEMQRTQAREMKARLRKKARADLLAERMRTARGDQLVGMTDDACFFELQILRRLPLQTLLRLPLVCRRLRDSTNGRGEPWFRAVNSAVCAHERREVRAAKESGAEVESIRERCARATMRLFKIPSGWALAPINTFKKRYDLMVVAKAHRDEYEGLRRAVRSSILKWKRESRSHSDSVRRMDGISESAAELAASVASLRSATAEALEFFRVRGIKTNMPPGLDAGTVARWEAFDRKDFDLPR